MEQNNKIKISLSLMIKKLWIKLKKGDMSIQEGTEEQEQSDTTTDSYSGN